MERRSSVRSTTSSLTKLGRQLRELNTTEPEPEQEEDPEQQSQSLAGFSLPETVQMEVDEESNEVEEESNDADGDKQNFVLKLDGDWDPKDDKSEDSCDEETPEVVAKRGRGRPKKCEGGATKKPRRQATKEDGVAKTRGKRVSAPMSRSNSVVACEIIAKNEAIIKGKKGKMGMYGILLKRPDNVTITPRRSVFFYDVSDEKDSETARKAHEKAIALADKEYRGWVIEPFHGEISTKTLLPSVVAGATHLYKGW